MTPTEPHILVVDDHLDIRDLLGKYLVKQGLRATTAANAAEARKTLQAAAIDLVVLDIMMPGEDGLSLCRYLRETTDIPVILLTAMAEETDRIVGLEMGADDYVTKPFNPRELLARIKAVLRRSSAMPRDRDLAEDPFMKFDNWTLDSLRRELTGPDKIALSLSTAEYRLLKTLLEHPGRVLSRDQLMDLTKGKNADVFDRSIDNQISRLRKKIEPDPKKPTLIKTVWGGGYQLTASVKKGREKDD